MHQIKITPTLFFKQIAKYSTHQSIHLYGIIAKWHRPCCMKSCAFPLSQWTWCLHMHSYVFCIEHVICGKSLKLLKMVLYQSHCALCIAISLWTHLRTHVIKLKQVCVLKIYLFHVSLSDQPLEPIILKYLPIRTFIASVWMATEPP